MPHLGSVYAATCTWNGSVDQFWGTNGNWDGCSVPVDNDDLIFPASPGGVLENDLTAGTIINSMSFDGDYTLSGNAIQLNAGMINNSSGTGVIINLAITLTGTQSFSANFSPTQIATVNALGYDLTIDGLANTVLSDLGSGLSGSGNLIKNEGATLVLESTSSTFLGNILLNDGTLRITNSDSMGAGGTTLVMAADTLLEIDAIDGTIFPQALNPANATIRVINGSLGEVLEWAGPVIIGGVDSRFESDFAELMISGALSGTGGFRAQGLINLTGNSPAYTPGLATDIGTLYINADFSGSSVISFGGDVAGIGTVNGITLLNNGELFPGTNGVGKLNSTDILDFGNGSEFNVQIFGPGAGTGYDQIEIADQLTMGTDVDINVALGFTPSVSSTYTVILDTSGLPISGQFSGIDVSGNYGLLAEGDQFVSDGYIFSISYLGGGVTLTAVGSIPEVTNVLVTPDTINEGASTSLQVDFTDLNAAESHTVHVNWGDGTTNDYNLAAGVLTLTQSHQYLDSFTDLQVLVTVENSIATSFEASSNLLDVNNVAPTITSPSTGGTGLARSLSGSIGDVGTLDSFVIQINWGDGSGVQNVNRPAGSTSFTANHTYSSGGTYSATYTILDDDGGSNNYNINITAVGPGGSTGGGSSSSTSSAPAVGSVTVLSPESGAVLTDSTPSFQWQPVDGAVQYLVYIAESGEVFIADGNLASTVTGTSFTQVVEMPNNDYQWAVVAIDAEGNVIAQSSPSAFSVQAASATTSSRSSSTSSLGAVQVPVSDVLQSLPPVASAETLAASAAILGGITAIGVVAGVTGSSWIGVISGIFVPKRRKSWGIVYDTTTSKPVPLATVRMFDNRGQVFSTVSDLQGAYGILLERAGSYRLQVQSSGYVNYSEKVDLLTKDSTVDVGLLPDQNSSEFSRFFNAHRPELLNGLRYGLLLAMIAGFIYSAYAVSQSPAIFNWIVLILYAVLTIPGVVLTVIPFFNQVHGRIIDSGTGHGIAGVIVKFVSNEDKASVITNANGELKVNLKPGTYQAVIAKQGYDLVGGVTTAAGVQQQTITVLPNGGIDQKLQMQKKSDYVVTTASLDSPFN